MFDSHEKPMIVVSRSYRPLEVVLGLEWSFGVDLWAIGQSPDRMRRRAGTEWWRQLRRVELKSFCSRCSVLFCFFLLFVQAAC